MQEKLLQFIWQYSLYQPGALITTDGEPVIVTYPGALNTNAGPDFLEARIRIGNTMLIGQVELHIRSSDWNRHGHQDDPLYNNVILHVVYQKDNTSIQPHIPVLELRGHIPQVVIEKYASLVDAERELPCAGQLPSVKQIVKESWLNRLLAERWEEKLSDWQQLLDGAAGDWRNLLYWRLAANFGFKVNAEPFLALARSLPLNILAKHRDDIVQTEALLFGQAGMLEQKWDDEYVAKLKTEYIYLRSKYQLQPITHKWKFLRMRPANFPTVRIAQFAALISKSVHLFSHIIETHTVKEILPLFHITASAYWDNHYLLGEAHDKPLPKKLGNTSIHNIIINTIAPIQFLYAGRQGADNLQERSVQLLEAVPAESNHITDLWKRHKWDAANAGHTQAQIQLYNNYCSHKRCLDCAIGLSILRP